MHEESMKRMETEEKRENSEEMKMKTLEAHGPKRQCHQAVSAEETGAEEEEKGNDAGKKSSDKKEQEAVPHEGQLHQMQTGLNGKREKVG